jgi:50S ribosomal subunit-associated GTPase HflX
MGKMGADQTTPPSGHPSYSGGEGRCLECLFISAKKKENIDELREVLYKRVRELHVQKYPYNDFLYNDYQEFEN